jgi:oxygen-independent coproporphyrinogen-3 oxidase
MRKKMIRYKETLSPDSSDRSMNADHLYVHIPFCASKCHYCAFNSYAQSDPRLFDRYVEALKIEWSTRRSEFLETIYVGGGTPSVLSGVQIHSLLTSLTMGLRGTGPKEITVEVNPGTTNPEFLEAITAAGVDRVSMGVQTMDARRLKRLGRVHTPDDVVESVKSLRQAGIKRISLDLIYGQPDQSMQEWLQDVQRLLDLEPDHLSLYALQYEEGTVFTKALEKGKLAELEEDLVLRMFFGAKERLSEKGYAFYEISNACRPGEESLHNLAYWHNRPYIGLGAGAYGGINQRRYRNELSPETYIKKVEETGHAVIEDEQLGPWETYVECLSSGLRMMEGVDLDLIAKRTGFHGDDFHRHHLDEIVERGLAVRDGSRIRLTWEGIWVLDTLLLPFLDEPVSHR